MLTRDDIELLMQALDALKDKQGMNDVFGSMIGLMLARNKEEAELNLKKIEVENLSKKDKQRMIEERIILLKAKLIQIRDSADISEFISGLSK